MIKFRKIADERQTQELNGIERIGFWVLFWGLFLLIGLKAFVFGAPLNSFIGEWVVFMAGCVVILVGCVRKGVWDYYTKPTWKTYILMSVIGTIIPTLVFGITKYVKYDSLHGHIFDRFIPMLIIFAAPIFIMILVAGAIIGGLVKRTEKRMEKDLDENE